MILGCTGNFRKDEFISIVTQLNEYINKNYNDIQLLVSSDMLTIHENKFNFVFEEFDELLVKSDPNPLTDSLFFGLL